MGGLGTHCKMCLFLDLIFINRIIQLEASGLPNQQNYKPGQMDDGLCIFRLEFISEIITDLVCSARVKNKYGHSTLPSLFVTNINLVKVGSTDCSDVVRMYGLKTKTI